MLSRLQAAEIYLHSPAALCFNNRKESRFDNNVKNHIIPCEASLVVGCFAGTVDLVLFKDEVVIERTEPRGKNKGIIINISRSEPNLIFNTKAPTFSKVFFKSGH